VAFTNAGAVNTTGSTNGAPGTLVNILDAVTQSCIVVNPGERRSHRAYIDDLLGLRQPRRRHRARPDQLSVSNGKIAMALARVCFLLHDDHHHGPNQVVTATEVAHRNGRQLHAARRTQSVHGGCGNATGGTALRTIRERRTRSRVPGTYVIGLKYDVKSISGTAAPNPHIITYTFTTSLGASTSGSVLLTDNKALGRAG
jgi:hypothetical protein